MKLLCDEYWTDTGRYFIDRTKDFLETYTFTEDEDVVIDGGTLGNDMSSFEIHVSYRTNWHLVTLSKKGESPDIYMFGLYVYDEDGEKIARTFHHSHGPFLRVYGFDYEY